MTATAARVGRFYTSARRHPWVLGKAADWKIPLGPYTPAQIAVAVGGGFLLVKTLGWWSWMGPVPIVAWLLAIWTVRRPKIRGRAPLQAALGWVLLGWQPHGGRISGRAARDRAPRPLFGSFTIEGDPVTGPTWQPWPSTVPSLAIHPSPDAGRPSAPNSTQPIPLTLSVGPASGVQQLLAFAQQGGTR
ncbi:hypothetical protein ABZ890_42100 [Streptomyces sp. NPDC046984]|uniref:hypothetical protein n=1 Tax=Streptomyces sp. NPDC046984 TaxID=3155138 RepID=UPI0034016A6E